MEEKDFSLEKNIEKIREIVERLQKGMENFDEHLALMKEGLDRIKKNPRIPRSNRAKDRATR